MQEIEFNPIAGGVLVLSFEFTGVKSDTIDIKASIAKKLNAIKAPKVMTWGVDKEGNNIPIEVPETGPGYEDYRLITGTVGLNASEAKHVRRNFDDILKDKGIPAKFAEGVYDVDAALKIWESAEE